MVQSLIYTPTADTAGRFVGPTTTSDNSGFTYLFYSNPFNTAGSITTWVFAAKKLKMSPSDSSTNQASRFPQLQIWRSMPDGMYELLFTTTIQSRPLIFLGALNMYAYELDLPARYERSDIIGLYQPSTANANLQIAFVNSDDTVLQALVQRTIFASTRRFTNNGRTSTVLPLMTLATKIAIDPSQTHSYTSSAGQLSIITSKVPDSTTLPTNTKPSTVTSRLENGVIIGISVGVLGPIALLIFVIILLLTLYIAKKKSNRKKFVVQNNLPLSPIGNQAARDNPLSNPTHTGSMGIISG